MLPREAKQKAECYGTVLRGRQRPAPGVCSLTPGAGSSTSSSLQDQEGDHGHGHDRDQETDPQPQLAA